MRHGKSFNHLGRKKAHREAMLSNMAVSLIMHKRIKTTVAKAKELRTYVEPLITKSKEDTTHSRRVVFSYLQSKEAVTELFREVSVKVAERPGGYTRILKTGTRMGDNAEMCIIELVDFNENMLAAARDSKAKTTRRSRRGGSKKTAEAAAAQVTAAAPAVQEAGSEVEEAVIVEEVTEAAPESQEVPLADEPTAEASEAEAQAEEPAEGESEPEADAEADSEEKK